MKICLSCEGVTDAQTNLCGYCDAPLLSADAVHYPLRRGEQDAGNPLLGTVVGGKYRLQSVLGRGGLGTVFRAQHVGSLGAVALKILHPRFSEQPEYRRALLPEARRAATVVHERCARLLDVGEGDEGITYLAMELVEGQTLDDVMREGALSPSHAVDLLLQITAALSAVHEAGLVHCDLSPRNVMVTARSGRLEVKVLDFGIARSIDMAGRQHAQSELFGFANPAFSAPELLLGAEVDARADLYSVGTLGWLMLIGEMPVDDADSERAAQAVREGRLSTWPSVTRIPKRLGHLIQHCLRFDPQARPISADEVHRQLLSVRTGRGPGLARIASVVAVLAILMTLAAIVSGPTPFLKPLPGSALERALTDDSRVWSFKPSDLANAHCYYNGFLRNRLQVEIARKGIVLVSFKLQPQEGKSGTLVLADAQDGWNQVIEGLVRASREAPVDLVFVVPGTELVRAARVRVDAEPPLVSLSLATADTGLRADTFLDIALQDDIGVQSAEVIVKFDSGELHAFEIDPNASSFALGAAIASRVSSAEQLGGGWLAISASDAAGNTARSQQVSFASADVMVPQVLAISGPANQRRLARHGDRLRWRVRLSMSEPGCVLRCRTNDSDVPVTVPLRAAQSNSPVWHSLDMPVGDLLGSSDEVVMHLAVMDAVGNVVEREFATAVVDRSPRLEIRAVEGDLAAPVHWTGEELIVGPNGGAVMVSLPKPYEVAATRLKRLGQLLDLSLIEIEPNADGAQLRLGQLNAGVYELIVGLAEVEELAEVADAQIEPLMHSIQLRVLPEQIEVTVPAIPGRYLKQLIDGGLLSKRGDGYGEGRGWRVDTDLRPYIGGDIWLGDYSSQIKQSDGALLPDVVPVSGRNVLALRMSDVLGRGVRLIDGDGRKLSERLGRSVVADFWWSDDPMQLVEELLVEHGSRARVRIRMPLPFLPEEASPLCLILPNGVQIFGQVQQDPLRSIASFDLDFIEWSAAAMWSREPREAYAEGLSTTIQARVSTPAAADVPFSFALQTARSTMSPTRLGDVAELPSGLKDLRLLPVLAPAEAFAEPASNSFPPRFTFRPQSSVDVRNMTDIMLQDREMDWCQARALADCAAGITDPEIQEQCVHRFDPLGVGRLLRDNLLPVHGQLGRGDLPDEAVLAGVDFFQAWTLSRLLGVAVAKDPSLFRLPLGCELELAAYGDNGGTACNGVSAQGGGVKVAAFVADTAPVAPWGSTETKALGDFITTTYGEGFEFIGLDFGVREWVLDLPHIPDNEMLLVEWMADHAVHLNRVMGMASGVKELQPSAYGLTRQFAVVRGLAFGESNGLIDSKGKPYVLDQHTVLPASVPGVLRTEQMRRDGNDLLGRGREPRLLLVGFRVAGNAKELRRLWGYR